jgi:hypothetical protein
MCRLIAIRDLQIRFAGTEAVRGMEQTRMTAGIAGDYGLAEVGIPDASGRDGPWDRTRCTMKALRLWARKNESQVTDRILSCSGPV